MEMTITANDLKVKGVTLIDSVVKENDMLLNTSLIVNNNMFLCFYVQRTTCSYVLMYKEHHVPLSLCPNNNMFLCSYV